MSTTLFHPNLPGVTRVRDNESEIAAHKKAGWLTEDPAEAAQKAAAEDAEKARRSEAAKKAAETRRKNAADDGTPSTSGDAPTVTLATDADQ